MYEPMDLDNTLKFHKPYWVANVYIEHEYPNADSDNCGFDITVTYTCEFEELSYQEQVDLKNKYERKLEDLLDEYSRKSGNRYYLINLTFEE